MITISPPDASTGKHSTPAACVNGASARYTGRSPNGYPISVSAVIVSRLALPSITPFGRPVVPPVPTIMARSSGSVRSGAGWDAPPLNASQPTVLRPLGWGSGPESVGSPSRHTNVCTFGSESRMRSTSGVNADW